MARHKTQPPEGATIITEYAQLEELIRGGVAHRRTDWSKAPVVSVTVPTCPTCGSRQYRRTRTDANGDGSATRKVICRECSAPYKIAIELPETGNDESAIG